MKDGGKFYIHTPNSEFFLEIMKKNNFIVRQFPEHIAVRNAKENCELLNKAGFEIDKLHLIAHLKVNIMLDSQTKQRINNARQVLVGVVPHPQAQIEQITTALIYKFMDDMDRENEEIGRQATFLTNELAPFAWGKLMSKALSGDARWQLYTGALDNFAKSKQIPVFFLTIFKDAYLPYRDSRVLNLFLTEINGFSYEHSEKLGDAFEYLLSISGAQADAGQFRTPRHIIDFITEIIAPQKFERILDPACGTAGFLISAYKHIIKHNSSRFNPNKASLPFAQQGENASDLAIQNNGYDGDKLTPDERGTLANNIHGYDVCCPRNGTLGIG